MGGASEISPQPQGSWNSGATHLTTEARPHTQGQGGGGARAAGLLDPSRSHWSPPTCPPPLAPCAGGRPFGAAGNWQTSCRSDLRLSWSPGPGSPAGNNTASSPASAHMPQGRRTAVQEGGSEASRPLRGQQSRRAGLGDTAQAPLARRDASSRGGSGRAGRAGRRVLRPVSDGSGSASASALAAAGTPPWLVGEDIGLQEAPSPPLEARSRGGGAITGR